MHKPVKKIRFTAYVCEDDADIVKHDLNDFFCDNEALMWGGLIEIEDMDPDHPEGYDITRFLYQMEEDEEETDDA